HSSDTPRGKLGTLQAHRLASKRGERTQAYLRGLFRELFSIRRWSSLGVIARSRRARRACGNSARAQFISFHGAIWLAPGVSVTCKKCNSRPVRAIRGEPLHPARKRAARGPALSDRARPRAAPLSGCCLRRGRLAPGV